MTTIFLSSFFCLIFMAITYFVLINLGKEREFFYNTIIKRQNETEIETREHIAYYIHEEIVKELNFIEKNFGRAQKAVPELEDSAAKDELVDYIQNSSLILSSVKQNISRLNNQIYPSVLKTSDFGFAVKFLVDGFQKNYDGTIYLDYEKELDNLGDTIKFNLYGIINLFINNSISHADCTTIDVKLAKQKNNATLYLADNGKGFNIQDISVFNKGIFDIRSRIYSLSPVHHVFESEIEQGTKLKLKFPITDAN